MVRLFCPETSRKCHRVLMEHGGMGGGRRPGRQQILEGIFSQRKRQGRIGSLLHPFPRREGAGQMLDRRVFANRLGPHRSALALALIGLAMIYSTEGAALVAGGVFHFKQFLGYL